MEELEQDVAALGMTTPPRRSGRKRMFGETPPTPPAKTAKRKSIPTVLTQDKLRKFYMNKTSAKFARQALETIYEDPVSKNGKPVLIGTPKVKRAINMDRDLVTSTKVKRLGRRRRIKRLGLMHPIKKLTDEEFKKRLKIINAYINADGSEPTPIAPIDCTPTPEKAETSVAVTPMDIRD